MRLSSCCISDGATAYSRARYGQGPASEKIILDDVGCIGTETNLGQCNYTALGLSNCDHTEDAGVRCNPGKPVCQILVLKYASGYFFVRNRTLIASSIQN